MSAPYLPRLTSQVPCAVLRVPTMMPARRESSETLKSIFLGAKSLTALFICSTVGTLMENHVLILRLRQNIFALAQHLCLSPEQLQELAEKADGAMQEPSSLDGVELAKRKRRSLHEILLGVMQDQEAARAHPRMAEPPAPYAPLKKRLAGTITNGPKQTHAHLEQAHLKSHHVLHSPQRKEGNPVPHVPARRFSDPPPGQAVILPSFQRIVRPTHEPVRTPYVVLPPIQIREQDVSTEFGSSPLSSRTPASLPSSLHSALSTSPESCTTPFALKSVGGLQMPVVQSSGLPSRFNDYRLPPPRPSQPLYQGIGPSLAAFVTSPSIGRSE